MDRGSGTADRSCVGVQRCGAREGGPYPQTEGLRAGLWAEIPLLLYAARWRITPQPACTDTNTHVHTTERAMIKCMSALALSHNNDITVILSNILYE